MFSEGVRLFLYSIYLSTNSRRCYAIGSCPPKPRSFRNLSISPFSFMHVSTDALYVNVSNANKGNRIQYHCVRCQKQILVISAFNILPILKLVVFINNLFIFFIPSRSDFASDYRFPERRISVRNPASCRIPPSCRRKQRL